MVDDRVYEEEVKLRDYLAVIRKRKGVILLIFFAVLASTIVGTLLMTPIYQASTTIQIEERDLGTGLLPPPVREWISPERASAILTEVEILKSRTIAEEVVRRLNLDKKVHRPPKGVSISVSPIKADSSARPGTYKVVFKDSKGGYEVLDEEGKSIGKAKAGAPFNGGGLSFTISNVNAGEGSSFKFTLLEFQKAVEGLRGNTKVESIRNTNIIKVSVESDDPERAAMMANTIADRYISQHLKRRTQQAFSAREFIGQQLDIVRRDLRQAERALGDFKAEKGVVLLDEEARATIEKLTRTELDRAKVETERKEAEALIALLREKGPDPKKGLILSSSGIANPLIVDLTKRLSDLEIQKSGLLEDYTEKHPQVVTLQTQIDEVKRKLIREVEATVNGLKERENALSSVIARYEAGLKRLPETELKLATLLRNSKVNEGIYTYLLQKHEEARIAEAAEIGNIRVIDPAIPPEKPIKPRKKLNALLGAILGLMMGLGLAFFQEYQDPSIKSVEELEGKVPLPVFGVIPAIADGIGRRRALKPGAMVGKGELGLQASLVTHMEPRSPAAEAYRSLRTNIQFADLERGSKAFLITSSGPGEGKTTIIANLAITMAQAGSRVLVVESDLRKPVLHSLFGLRREPGLSDVLAERIPWPETVQETGIGNLYLISSGLLPPNPSELLGSNRMGALIQEFKREYDMVILDSPPVIPVTDASVLGSKLDGVFLVVEAGKSTSEAVKRAKSLLDAAHARIMGVIFNRLRIEDAFGRPGYYYTYYYYYQEKEDGRKEGGGRFSSFWRRK